MISDIYKNCVVIDTETSGLNAFRHDILSIGIVPVWKQVEPIEIYVKSESSEWSDFGKNNFSRFSHHWNKEAVTPEEACVRLEEFLFSTFSGEEAIPIGHNIGFDTSFLKKLAYLSGKDELAYLSHRAIDTHTLLFVLAETGKVPSLALTSDGAFRYFDIEVPSRDRHTALGDAKATKALFLKIMEELAPNSRNTMEDKRLAQ